MFIMFVYTEHYQAFNAALPHHTSLLNHLDATQEQIKEARIALQEAKETLGSKRADLVQLWTRNQTVEEMMRILDQMSVAMYSQFYHSLELTYVVAST